jgi:hypothetical protein
MGQFWINTSALTRATADDPSRCRLRALLSLRLTMIALMTWFGLELFPHML